MEVLEIPIVSNTAHFVQEHEIFKKSFFLEFEWLEQEKFWLLHIFDQQGQALNTGIKLMPNWPLYTYNESKKPFRFLLLGKSPAQNIGRHNLTQDFSLVVYEAF